jgi:hypothetical protein
MMSVTLSVSREALAELQQLIATNPSVDWRTAALDDLQVVDGLEWGTARPRRGELLPILMAYQRLVRILPTAEERRALPLLEAGLHSAIQIAGLARDEFIRRWGALFPGEDALGLAVHQNALSRRSALLLHHIDDLQHNEPHYRAARFR